MFKTGVVAQLFYQFGLNFSEKLAKDGEKLTQQDGLN
jgi:hypothetical protein